MRVCPWLLVLALAACAAPPRPRIPDVPAAPDTALARAQSLPPPPGIERPAELACAYETLMWWTGEGLRFTPRGRPFARVVCTLARFEISVGPVTGALADLDASGVHFRGIVDMAQLALYPARAFVTSDVLIPRPQQNVELLSAEHEKVTFSFPLDSRIRLLKGSAHASRSCADLTLKDPYFRPRKLSALTLPQAPAGFVRRA